MRRKALSWIRSMGKSMPVADLLKELRIKKLPEELMFHLNRSGVCSISDDEKTVLHTALLMNEETAKAILGTRCMPVETFKGLFRSSSSSHTAAKETEKRFQDLVTTRVLAVMELPIPNEEAQQMDDERRQQLGKNPRKRAHKPPPRTVFWNPLHLRGKDTPLFRERWKQ